MPEVPNFKNYVRRLYTEDADGKFEVDMSDGTFVALSSTDYQTNNSNYASVLNDEGTLLVAPDEVDNTSSSDTHNAGVPFSFDNEQEYTIQVDWRRNSRDETWAGDDVLLFASYDTDLQGGSGYELAAHQLEGKDSGTALVRVGPGKGFWDDRVDDDANEKGFYIRTRGDIELSKIVVAEGDRTTQTIFLNGVGVGSDGNSISIPKLLVAGNDVKGFSLDGERVALTLNNPGKVVGLTRGDTDGRFAGSTKIGDPALAWKNRNGALLSSIGGSDFSEFEGGIIKLTKPGRYQFMFTITWVGADIGERYADVNFGTAGNPESVLVPTFTQGGNSYLKHRFETDIRYINSDTQYVTCTAFWSPLGLVTAPPNPSQLIFRVIRVQATD